MSKKLRAKSATNERKPSPFASEEALAELSISGPATLGLFVVLLLAAALVAAAGLAPIDRGVGLSGTLVVETKVKPVQHLRGGTIEKVHVSEGETVELGDTLFTLDTRSVREELTALLSQATAADRQLELARQEAATIGDLFERKLASKSRLLGLQRQVAQIEKEEAALRARIAVSRQQLEEGVVKAPVAGKILSVAVRGRGAVVQPGETLLELVPGDDRLVIEGLMSPDQVENVREGMAARVWLSALNWREREPIAAKLIWVSPDSVLDERSGRRHFRTRLEFSVPREEVERQARLWPGMRTEILLLTGKRTLLDTLIAPLMRNVARSFREAA